jgi:ABC-type transporter Mla subunit MlaD
LAHDLVDRLKPILDSVNITASALNQPDGLVQHAKSVAVQVEKASEAAIELMKQIQVAIGTSNVKINQALDKTDALLVKTDGVLDNVQRITSEAGKITAASAESLLPLIRDGRVAAEDVRNIIGASKEVWPIRNFIDTGGENMLPMDSYGVTHVQPK